MKLLEKQGILLPNMYVHMDQILILVKRTVIGKSSLLDGGHLLPSKSTWVDLLHPASV